MENDEILITRKTVKLNVINFTHSLSSFKSFATIFNMAASSVCSTNERV